MEGSVVSGLRCWHLSCSVRCVAFSGWKPLQESYRDPSIQIIPIMENQMEQEMENEMETGDIKGLYRDLSIQIILTLGPKACTYYLHWAI